MIATLIALLSGTLGKILAVVAPALLAFFGGHRMATKTAENKTLKTIIKAEKDRANAETDAAAGGAADRLHRDFQRK